MDDKTKEILTRIFITEEGDLIVTDLWEEVQEAFCGEGAPFREED